MTRIILDARIVVLNYNGRELMTECLPSIVEAAKASKRRVGVTVIDNKSTDGSVEFLRKNFPDVHIDQARENRILCSYNDSLKKMSEPIAILLNNDIKVDPNFVDPLADLFERDETLFAVGSKVLDFDGKGFQGEKSVGGIRWGMFWTDSRYDGHLDDIDKRSWTVQVALGAFDREKFVMIGGYDDLYLPGTWEDTDISLRAYRRGWHCLYEPKSVIYHKGQATFHREFGKKGTSALSDRNAFLFFWKNFGRTPQILAHVFFLPMRLLYAVFTANSGFLRGFWSALPKAGAAFSRAPRPVARLDNEILSAFSERKKTK